MTVHMMEKIPCPVCREKKINISMILDENKDFWRCPLCWTEVWPDENKLKELVQEIKSKILEKKMKEASKHSIYPDPLPLVPIVDPSKRRSGKSGKSRKKQVNKLRFYELQ